MVEVDTLEERAAMEPVGRRECPTLLDRVVGLLAPAVLAPVEEPDEELTPERVLRAEAAELGVRILDLRGRDRRLSHPFRHHCVVRDGEVLSVRKSRVLATDEDFGIWGWFGGGKNAPKRGRVRGRLPWVRTTTTVLHTMAVHAGAPRCVGMPVQNAIAKDGTIVLLQSIRSRMWHAHAANKLSDGIEISGKSSIADHQIGPARALLRYVIASKRRNLLLEDPLESLGPLFVMPHAFSHWSRQQDCGAAIWAEVGRWGLDELGLERGHVIGSGKAPKWASVAA
jgi:hypothetical protein